MTRPSSMRPKRLPRRGSSRRPARTQTPRPRTSRACARGSATSLPPTTSGRTASRPDPAPRDDASAEPGQHLAPECLDEGRLVAPHVVQVDPVEAELEVLLDPRRVAADVG